MKSIVNLKYIEEFGNNFTVGIGAEAVQQLLQNINIPEEIKALIIRMDRVPYIDQSGLYALENAVLDLEKRGIQVLLTALQEQPKDKLVSIDIVPDLISEEHIFSDIKGAFDYLKSHFKL